MAVRLGFGDDGIVARAIGGIAPALRGGAMAIPTLVLALALSACSEPASQMNPATGLLPMGTAGTTAGMGGTFATAGAAAIGGAGAGGMAGGTAGAAGVVSVPTAGAGGAGAGAGGAGGMAGTGGQPTAGTTGEGGAGAGAGGTGGMGGMGGMPAEDLGAGDGHDVITIGDSWMSLGLEGIQQSLVTASGGQDYRLYGVAGTRMLDGVIPAQYDQAKRANPDIKTVVMTGGGNDVLLTGLSFACSSGAMSCLDQLIEITDTLKELWAEMAADGVRDVVYVMYAKDAGDGLHESLDHDNRLMMACGGVPAPLRCHLLFSDPFVMGQYRDGVHPTRAGYTRLGKGVYDLMVAEGMRR